MNVTIRRPRSLSISTYAHVVAFIGLLKSVAMIMLTILIPALRPTAPASMPMRSTHRTRPHVPMPHFTLSLAPPPKCLKSCLSPDPPSSPASVTFALDSFATSPLLSPSRPKLIKSLTSASVHLRSSIPRINFPKRKSSFISPLERDPDALTTREPDGFTNSRRDKDELGCDVTAIPYTDTSSSDSGSTCAERPRIRRSIDSFMSDVSSTATLVNNLVIIKAKSGLIKPSKVLQVGALKRNALKMKRRATTMFS